MRDKKDKLICRPIDLQNLGKEVVWEAETRIYSSESGKQKMRGVDYRCGTSFINPRTPRRGLVSALFIFIFPFIN